MADVTWPEKLRLVAQEKIPEPVRAAGLLAPGGAMGSFGVSKLSGLAGMMRDRQANQRSGGLGHTGAFKLRQALIAVTDAKVYGFNAKPKGRSGYQIVGDAVVEWDRADVRTTVQDRTITKLVVFEVGPDGTRYELEMMKMAGDLNDGLFAELLGDS